METRQVILKGNSEKNAPTEGEVQILHWTQPERLKRALKFGGICWGIALFSVIIPGLHFILVPGFLLAGPIVAFKIYETESVVMGGKGVCPECGAPFRVERGKLAFPLLDKCSKCFQDIKVETRPLSKTK